MEPKVILISDFQLPYEKIGSWTNMYRFYFENNSEKCIDYIVCPKPKSKFKDVKYYLTKKNLIYSLSNLISKKNRFDHIISAIDKIIRTNSKNQKFILQVIDNKNLIFYINKFLIKNKIRDKIYIQYFYHGFPPNIKIEESYNFFMSINEMVFLTKLSYFKFIEYYPSMPINISILNNGVDTDIFYELTKDIRERKRRDMGIENKIIFVWLSKDRPSKGLSIIINTWDRIIKEYENIELWVIGTDKKEENIEKKIKFIGNVEHHLLPDYLQISDCYLFPTLVQEGFGLSLIEALHCGNYCIASNIGGVSEVIDGGKDGLLIDMPHEVNSWERSIKNFIFKKIQKNKFDNSKYTIKSWVNELNKIIYNAKNNIKID